MTARIITNDGVEHVPQWELASGSTYMVTLADLDGGRNKLGIEYKGPLDTLLCGFCDTPLPTDGRCEPCCTIHTDIADAHLRELGNGWFRSEAA